jgi:hypothetical protein
MLRSTSSRTASQDIELADICQVVEAIWRTWMTCERIALSPHTDIQPWRASQARIPIQYRHRVIF